MRFNNRNNFINHFALSDIPFWKGVERKILIKPDPTIAFLVNCNHRAHNLKASESIIKPFEAQHRFLEQIERLPERHLIDLC